MGIFTPEKTFCYEEINRNPFGDICHFCMHLTVILIYSSSLGILSELTPCYLYCEDHAVRRFYLFCFMKHSVDDQCMDYVWMSQIPKNEKNEK